MEAVLDVGGGEGGAHGVRGVAMDIADGGDVLGLALDHRDETGVSDVGGDCGVVDGDGVGGRGCGVGARSVECDASWRGGDCGDGLGARSIWVHGGCGCGADVYGVDRVDIREQRHVQDTGRGVEDTAGHADTWVEGDEQEHGSVV